MLLRISVYTNFACIPSGNGGHRLGYGYSSPPSELIHNPALEDQILGDERVSRRPTQY
ncbi:hypothetical protein PC116_g2802 [Phytophthora cactorum]|uniref:Uncharacterized protein n=1 Tax=Phytophthora cactorum TaxID=29920 RepID=A0A329SBF6_9STRA|nr:hypothetical protein PC116_g2802 [Phytophthora cactorum]RAW34183.1 hypothetical protein PC110_g9511 [Phytophthora cactorum]